MQRHNHTATFKIKKSEHLELILKPRTQFKRVADPSHCSYVIAKIEHPS